MAFLTDESGNKLVDESSNFLIDTASSVYSLALSVGHLIVTGVTAAFDYVHITVKVHLRRKKV